jgi:S1-C subfamily serine protease
MGRSKLSILPLALSLSALILISSLINQGQSQILEDSISTLTLPQVFSRSANSVVQVLNPTLNATIEDMSSAAGFVYDREGHIVTALSAVPDGADLLITFMDGSTYNATLIGSDPFSDVAVLSTDSIPEGKLVPLSLGNSTELQIGEQVAAIGNPFGLSGVLTEGVVGKLGAIIPSVEEEEEAVDEDAEVDTPSFSIPDIIVTDVPLNPGNAGGPLLNTKGEVVGINVAVFSTTGDFAGISFSVPSDSLKKIVPSLIINGSYAHPWLGISGMDITPQIAEVLNLEMPMGFLITDLAKGGPADKADIRGGDMIENISGREVALGGDIVVAIDNKTVRKIDDILNYIEREKDVGDMVSLTILRGGQNMDVNVILDKRTMRAPTTTSTTATTTTTADNITITGTNLMNFLTYENSTYGIRIQYPPDWEVDETDDYPDDGVTDIVQFLSPLQGRLDYQESVFVSTEPLPQQDLTLSTYVDQLIDFKNETINGFELIESNTSSTLGSNNNTAYNMTYYETGDDGIQYRTVEVGTIIGDEVYYINYFAEVDKYSDYWQVVVKMINSFDVTPPS